MLISPAFAQDAAAGASGLFESIMPLILIMAVFYFLLIRPQQKKVKEHKAMLTSVRRGDRIITGGGILATVTKVINDGELQVEIAEGVKVRVDRSTVSGVVSKTEPADSANDADDADAGDDDTSGGKKTVEKKSGGLKGLLSGKG